MAASNGQVAVKVPDAATIRAEVPVKIADIKPGMYVASSSQKQSDGTFRASQINIFPEEQRGLLEGHRPQTSRPGNMMTNANVEKIEEVAVKEVKGPMLTLKYKDEEIKVFVPPNTPIVRREVADRQMLKPGATVNISATQSSDGSVAASQVTISVEPM